jgi:hypothetical protein
MAGQASLGNAPRTILEELAATQSADVVLPTATAIKSAIAATFRSGSKKHAPRRLAEFEYRFNRRYDLPAMMPRLGWVAARTPPMPYRLLKLAEDYG